MASFFIGEVTKRTGIPASTLRYYESLELVPKPDRVGGRRVYSESWMKWLGIVMLAQQCGFTLREIKCFVKGFPNMQSPAELWQQAAGVKIDALKKQRDDIDRTIDLLGQVGTCQCRSFQQCGQRVLEGRQGG